MKRLKYVVLLVIAVVIGALSWPSRNVTAVVPLSQKAFAKPELRVRVREKITDTKGCLCDT